MSDGLVTVIVILFFTMLGGLFAAAEIALVSLRDSQVARLAETGGRRGRRLAALVADPNRFLAAVQVGVTAAGFVSAGFGASRIVPMVTPLMTDRGVSQAVADTVAFVVVTIVLVYVSLVLGELVPKRLGLQRSESIALLAAPVVDRLATLTRPFILLLSKSTDLIVGLLGGKPTATRETYSGEEIRTIVATHELLSPEERALIDDVFEAGERELREVMVPRTEVSFLDGDVPIHKAVRLVAERPHSRYPVVGQTQDDVLGFVHVRDLYNPDISDRSMRVRQITREVVLFPTTKHVIPALTYMRRTGSHLAIVVDEYGGTAGIVTLEDLVEELVGDIRDEYDVDEQLSSRTGATVAVDGLLNLEDFEEETGLALPDGPYETVAGYIMAALGRLPLVGDSIEHGGRTLTVLELDGRRASRISISDSVAAVADAPTDTPRPANPDPASDHQSPSLSG